LRYEYRPRLEVPVQFEPGSYLLNVYRGDEEDSADDEPRQKPDVVATLIVAAIAIALSLTVSAWFLLLLLATFFFVPASAHGLRVSAPTDELLDALSEEADAERLKALVIGAWQTENDLSAEPVVERLIRYADCFPELEALFIGDITWEECEISWIAQTDLASLADGFPNLRILGARGGDGLRFEGLDHPSLEHLVVQTGGMWTPTIEDLAAARLPQLRELELWLGDPNYGFEATVDDLRPLWQSDTFPNLEMLALRNAPIADEIAAALAQTPGAVARLARLDLSMGTLTDEGAEALLDNPEVAELDSLDVHHHYLSDEWIERLQSLEVDVDTSDARGTPFSDLERYVAVSE
jgi:hypothetical protein